MPESGAPPVMEIREDPGTGFLFLDRVRLTLPLIGVNGSKLNGGLGFEPLVLRLNF